MIKHFFKRLFLAFCMIIIFISAWYLYHQSDNYIRSGQTFKEVVNLLITDEKSNEEEKELKNKYQKEYSDINFPNGLLLKYYPLYAKNQDLMGFISIPELNFNYPIMQSNDNDYYLRRDIKGNYNVWGTPFFNYTNKFNPNDKNLIIFGHNTDSFKTKMFAALNVYLTLDGFKKAPVIECDTIYEEIYWKVYAVYITNAEPKDDNGNFFNYIINNFSKEEFTEYINEIDKRAIYNTGVDIGSDDNILTISTCNYSFKNARMVIVCRQIRPNESKDVNLSLVRNNPNPRYPQAWYDKKGRVNPFNY